MAETGQRWHSGAWWAAVSGIVSILGLVVAILTWVHPFGGGAPAPPAPEADGLVRSPKLGLEVYQDDRRVLLQQQDDHVTASFPASRRFEIRFAALQHDQGLHVCAATDDSVFDPGRLFAGGQCFGWGSGMADTQAGSENLYLSTEGHNYFVGERIALASDGFQTVYLGNLVDVATGQPRAKPWGTIYLTVLRDTGPDEDPLNTPEPRVDANDLEFLELHFA